jgi:hypothetical protein
VIPANRKWFRNLTVAEIIRDTLKGMKMKFPKPAEDISKLVIE